MPRPNIIMIQTDSHDGRAMGLAGHPALEGATPNMDRLAGQGVTFVNSYCNNPICCPSRASMWSGRWTHHCRGWNNYKGLEPGQPTMRTRLNVGGYVTQTFGKLDYLSGAHTIRARVTPWTRSARIMRPSYRMAGPYVEDADNPRVAEHDWDKVDKAIDWLDRVGRLGQPFWLYLGWHFPHPRFRTSRTYLDRIDPARVTVPPLDESDHPTLEYQRLNKNWMHGWDDETVRLVRRIYYAMIAEVDEMLGAVLSGVEQAGLAGNTYVIFTSDHGELAMEHRQWYKSSMYEGSVRVPLIFSGPGVRPGLRVDKPASLVDVYPTLMDMAGLPTPEGLDGHSLLPEAVGRGGDRPGWVLSEYHGTSSDTGQFMLRQDDWKYIAYPGYRPQLFHLGDDPDEIHDLHADRPDVVDRLDAKLRRIVDYPAVDAEAKAYDRSAFAAWRAQRQAEGDYRELMARVYSGWDGLSAGDPAILPWTDEDEQQIEAWLNQL